VKLKSSDAEKHRSFYLIALATLPIIGYHDLKQKQSHAIK